MSDFDWVEEINIDPTTMFKIGIGHRVGLLYGSQFDDVSIFRLYDRSSVGRTYEDGRGVLYFDGHEFTPLYIESQLGELGLTLYDLF